jgi:osmotically-inducible protein OsmY
MSAKVQPKTDDNLRETVLSQFEWEPEITSKEIGVTAQDGVVTLEGTVDWRFQKQIAEEAVRFLGGVRGISNEIEVMPEVKPKISPEQVRTRIEDALRRSAEVDSRRIRVEISANRLACMEMCTRGPKKKKLNAPPGPRPGSPKLKTT